MSFDSTMKPKALLILGPTASGKTALALNLVDRFRAEHPLEIISIDSALVYRDMNIGTAKPDAASLKEYPHHLVDIIDPTVSYSAAEFCRDATRLMHEIVARGNTPLIVGGTMLYAKALLEGISDMPAANDEIRREIARRAIVVGWPAMHAELASVDSVTAARLKPNDSQRIQRALEVFEASGTPISKWQQRNTSVHDFPFDTLTIGLMPSDRAVLHRRIEARFDAMLKDGLVDEVQLLKKKYALHPDLPSMRAVGYRQAWEFIEANDASADAKKLFREKSLAASRQLAKRQMTWLRAMPHAEIVDCLRDDLAEFVAQRAVFFFNG
jgi:tRNA dimethylallyltransferase